MDSGQSWRDSASQDIPRKNKSLASRSIDGRRNREGAANCLLDPSQRQYPGGQGTSGKSRASGRDEPIIWGTNILPRSGCGRAATRPPPQHQIGSSPCRPEATPGARSRAPYDTERMVEAVCAQRAPTSFSDARSPSSDREPADPTTCQPLRDNPVRSRPRHGPDSRLHARSEFDRSRIGSPDHLRHHQTDESPGTV